MTGRSLLDDHVDALYVHTDTGRLLCCNDLTHRPAPRLYLGRSHHEVTWRLRCDVPDALAGELAALCQDERPTDDLRQPPRHAATYAALLRSTTPPWSGPAMYVPTRTAEDPSLMVVTVANRECLRGALDDWIVDVAVSQPFIAAMEDGHAVAVCCSVRISPRAHEAGVETAPSHRGLGLAPAVVTAWAHAVARIGATPLYSTSWSNFASQRVAAKVGGVIYASDFHLD